LQDFLNVAAGKSARKFVSECGSCQGIKHECYPPITGQSDASLCDSVPLQAFTRGDVH
jgi:hypothetical protein